MRSERLFALGSLVLCVAFSCASADIMTFDGMGLSRRVKIDAAGTLVDGQNIYAGQMRVTYQGQSYLGYSVDINQYAGTGQVNERSWETLNNGEHVAYLFKTYADTVDSKTKAAALQTAIWEVMYETEGSFDLRDGYFRAHANANVAAEAGSMLAGLPHSYAAETMLKILQSDCKQDILIGTGESVPEPGVLALFSLVGLRVLSPRRRK